MPANIAANRLFIATFLTFLLLSVVACKSPKSVKLDEIKGICPKSSNGDQRVVVEGYVVGVVDKPDSTGSVSMGLSSQPGGQPEIKIYIKSGKNAEQIESQNSSPAKNSFIIHTSNGESAGPNDRLRIFTDVIWVGPPALPPEDAHCFLGDPLRIEKL